MNSAIRNLGLILSLLLLISCHKSSDSDPNSNGTRLSKMIVTDFSFNYVDSYEFHYDSLNRVTEIIHSSGNSVNELQYERTQTCFYKTGEQLPYKTVGFEKSFVSAERYYTYDNIGQEIRDSTTDINNNYTIHTYDWHNDRVLIRTVGYSPQSSWPASSRDSAAISNNNITAWFSINHPLGQPILGFRMSHDDKVNPLNTLNIHAIVEFSGAAGGPLTGYSKNNINEWLVGILDESNTFTKTDRYVYNYQYNTVGLPINCQQTNVSTKFVAKTIKYYYAN
jgi:hypothetical protein